MKIPQTKNELLDHLKNQINFLRHAADRFDKGDQTEALIMATHIRTLLHDTKNSKSLLGQLDKKGILFHDMASDFDPNNLLPHHGLIQIEVGTKRVGFHAGLDNVPPFKLNRKVPFDSWWNKVILTDKERNRFTRKDIVLFVANKDGGAHIDPSLDEIFAKLSRLNSMEWRKVENGVDSPFERPDYPSVRQMAHEVLKTLKDEFPEYF